MVAPKKENHPCEVYMRRGRRKDLYTRERDYLEGPHEEAEMQRNTLRRGKNLAFSEDTPSRKERLSPTSKARREASRNEFMEKSGMPDRVESFRESNSSEDRPRARPGFVKPIRNGLRKVQNLIESRPSRAETGLAGRENETRLHKEE